MSWETIPILLILCAAALGNNQSVAVAAALLLIIKMLGLNSYFAVIEDKGLSIGVTILTLAILAPVASGKVSLVSMLDTFKTPAGILSLAAGIFAAWTAGQGLFMVKASPELITSLVTGTVVGVCFLNGVAIGPLIAGGLVMLILKLFRL